jgi:N-acetyl-anhydromuramyl-L-alanine amidase AmpD
MPLDLSKIIQKQLPENQFYKTETPKNQIVLHHTVSGPGIDGDFATWLNSKERIATAIIVARDGKIYQTFPSKYWGHHLGITSTFLKDQGFNDAGTRNNILNQNSVGIEIDSWGGLIQENGKWYVPMWDTTKRKYVPRYNLEIPKENVVEYPKGFRDFKGFEKYTDEQLAAVKDLLEYFCEKYNIPKDYKEDMWDVSKKALAGEKGIWAHVSFRKDKSDCYPDERISELIKSLS